MGKVAFVFLLLSCLSAVGADDAPKPESGQVEFSVPYYIRAGATYHISEITLWGADGIERKVTGKLMYRRAGQKAFTAVELGRSTDGKLFGEIPGKVTAQPFEYYLELTVEGKPPVCFPAPGADAPRLITPDASPPSRVAELVASKVRSSSVTLDWKPATDDIGIRGYYVHRGADENFALNDENRLVWLPAEQLSYTDERPRMGKTAWYAVVAVDLVGRIGEPYRLKVDVPDIKAPDNRLDLQAHPLAHAIRLSWDGDVEPDVTSFIILRGEGENGELKEIKTLQGANHREYTDTGLVPGKLYRYAIKLTNSSWLVSAPTRTVMARPRRFVRRINCGGPEVPSSDGVTWEADAGRRADSSAASVRNDVANAEGLQAVYQSERWSYDSVQYKLDVPPGQYRVVLHFAETNFPFAGFGKRTFDVVINGEKVAEKLDVFSKAGAFNAWKFYRKVTVPKEKPELKIQLIANPSGPAIKGIEVIAED